MHPKLEAILLRIHAKVMGFILMVFPTKKPILHTGHHAALQLCDTIAAFGNNHVLIVTDAILMKLGVIDPIQKALDAAGVKFTVFSEVEPDPTCSIVNKGTEIYRQSQCDSVLAIGGGSSMDAGKGIAILANNPKLEAMDLAKLLSKRKGPVPYYAIPTTAGTGSEATLAVVISNDETHEKYGIADWRVPALACAVDAKIMSGMPPTLTAATGMDALTHAIESYIATIKDAESDAYAKAAIRLIFANLAIAYKDGGNLQARQSMGMASFYGGWALNNVSLGYVHGIAHQLGRVYGVPHGDANAMVLPHILEFSKDAARERLAELGRLIGVTGDSSEEQAQAFIDATTALARSIGIPETLDKLQADDIHSIATGATKEAKMFYAAPKHMSVKTCMSIVEKLLPITAAQNDSIENSTDAADKKVIS